MGTRQIGFTVQAVLDGLHVGVGVTGWAADDSRATTGSAWEEAQVRSRSA